jgi:hypothetical protein
MSYLQPVAMIESRGPRINISVYRTHAYAPLEQNIFKSYKLLQNFDIESM